MKRNRRRTAVAAAITTAIVAFAGVGLASAGEPEASSKWISTPTSSKWI